MREAIEYSRGTNMVRVESDTVLSRKEWQAVNDKMREALDLLEKKEGE